MLNRLNPAPSITPGMLHSDLPMLVVASVIFAAGLASAVLWRLKSRDPLLLWLGVLALLYALRIFLSNPLILIATSFNGDLLRQAAAVITFCIPIPLVLFFRNLIGAGWKNHLTIWLWVQVAFAALAVTLVVFDGYLDLAEIVNNILVIGGSIVLLIRIFFYRAESGAIVIKVGFVILVASVLLRNLGATVGPVIEPFGLLCFVCALGYAAALRTISREKVLLAVEQELATARRIQASILPKSLPQMAALEIATRYVPMTAVAGDFYDFLIVDQHRVTIVVADVSGHGVPAALIASMLKVGIAAQRENASNPAAVLDGLNTMLQGSLDGQFVTAACAHLDLEAHTLTYSGAGHPPALLARKGNPVISQITENGLFLGPFPKATYTNITVPFQSGDKLLLYTDGIIEATLASGQPFGDEGIHAFMIRSQSSSVRAFADDLILAVSGPVQEDDLTVVIAEAK